MRVLRIGIHLIVTVIMLLIFFWASTDFVHHGAKAGKILGASAFVLFIAACIGLMLELRSRRNAAFLNPAIPFVFSVMLIVDFYLFADAESAAVMIIFYLVPLLVSALQAVLYYMAWHSESLRD